MDTSVERLDDHTVRLTVTSTAEEVDEAVEAAYKRVGAKLKIPGFRAGKVPKPVIDTHVGRDAVLEEAREALVDSTYGMALDAERLRPIASPEIGDLDKLEPGTAYEYIVEVQIRPELTLSSIEGLEIEAPSDEVEESEIDAQIEHMRDRFATLELAEGRGIEKDDFVLLSFVGTVDGEPYEGNAVDKYLYEMNRGLMPSAFDDGLLGIEAGGKTTVEFEIPASSSNPEFVGKTARFEVMVHEVKSKVLPEIDDEFAATAGGYDSIEEMRAAIRDQTQSSKSMGRARLLEREARVALAERLEGEVPQAMVDQMRDQMMRDFVNGLEAREMTLQDYVVATGVEPEQIKTDIEAQAARTVREELALEALFRLQGWEVTEEAVECEIREMSGDDDRDPAELRKAWEEAGVITVLHEQIMHRNATAWLMDEENVVVKTKKKEDADASAEAPSDESSHTPADDDTAEEKE